MSTPQVNPGRERHWICAGRLRERRLALGLTQREVVDRLAAQGSATTNRALSAMENGRGLDLGLLPELAESLRCSVTYLLGLASDPGSWLPDGHAHLAMPIRPSHEDIPPRSAEMPKQRAAGILGADVPVGFAGRARRRSRTEEAPVP